MKADLILKSKNIFTGNGDMPAAGGVAVKGNKIIGVGSDLQEYAGEDTKVLDFGEKLIMPAFVDAHTHYFQAALSESPYMCMDITYSTSEADCIRIMKEYEAKHPEMNRLRGMGWFPANWNDAPLPTKESLDKAFPDKPVYLLAADAHTMWMNTLALEEAGYSADMVFDGGSVGTYENGEMNGLVFEPDACVASMKKLLEFDAPIREEIYKSFNQKMNAYGITAVSEMTGDDYDDDVREVYELIKGMEARDEFNCRLHVYTKLAGYTDFTKAVNLNKTYCSEKMRVAGVKGFVDGVTSTYTGLLNDPYEDKPDTCGEGVPLFSEEDAVRFITAANGAGLPVRLHCVGDGAVRFALDAFEASQKINGKQGLANTVEHIETIYPEDIPRFAELDVIPSMQPYHMTIDANEKIRRMGEKRCRWEWPHKTILESGAKLAFGSDCPVISVNPFPNIYSAVTRLDDDGKPTGADAPEHISMAQTLMAYTQNAARAYGRDDIGTLKDGNLADIIVIDGNLFDMEGQEILNASVEMTLMDGKIVYDKSNK